MLIEPNGFRNIQNSRESDYIHVYNGNYLIKQVREFNKKQLLIAAHGVGWEVVVEFKDEREDGQEKYMGPESNMRVPPCPTHIHI